MRNRLAADYESVEAVFERFRTNLGNARYEIESALRELIYEYSTSNPENRFVVGGAAEIIIAAAMRASGIDTENLGHKGEGADLETFVEALGRRFSIKAVFSKKSSSTRLVNFLGSGTGRVWSDPTLFVIAELGIVLGHPGHASLVEAVRAKGDALEMPLAAVRTHAQRHPELLIPLNLPYDPKSGTRVASVDVARSILSKPHYPILGKAIQADSTFDRLFQAELMLERGRLTEDEFSAIKRRILETMGN